MENNIVCSRCGSANVRCEAMVNPNTKGFDHFTDEAFYYGWCENCGLGVALTDKEEIRNEILEKYHRFKKENACEPHYANCRIVQRDSGQVKDVRIMLSPDTGMADDGIFFYCHTLERLIGLSVPGRESFTLTECFGFALLTDRDNTEKIVYDMDLEEVRLVANLVPGKSARYDYVAQENKQHNADTPAKPDGMNDLQSIAHSCSEKAYTAKTTSAADPHVTDKAELDEQMRIVKNASGANLLNIKGIGKTCRIRIGEIIDVSFPDRMKLPPLGKFRIVGIEHEVCRDGHYSNSFVGVPDSTVHIPVPDAKRPLALPELATVKENNDDKGQGRVKVAFDWQKNGKTTNWIRVQTPNAGVSGAVPKNRGWVFVPEVGDQVMVSYEHGNPDRPYVTGSVFHSGSGKGGDKDNKVKSIITRSGNAIVFDDETGSIVITDQTGKQLIMLDGTDAITVMAKKSITLTNEAESVIVMDDKSIGLQADTIALEGRKSVTLLSGNECMVLSSEKSIISSSGTNIKQEATKDYDVAAKNGTVNGVNLMIEGKGNVTVSGGIVKFNS